MKLFLFTSTFPYGKGETFLENEITFLENKFNIDIYPLYLSIQKRKTKKSTISSPLKKGTISTIFLKNIFNVKMLYILSKCLFSNYTLFSKKGFFNSLLFTTTVIDILKNKSFIKKLESLNKEDILYFYWGVGSVYILPFINTKAKVIVRFHGSDIYKKNYPFREKILKRIDKCVFISENGKEFLNKEYPNLAENKSIVSKLGTMDKGITLKKNKDHIHIVSCSNVIPLKRVIEIPNALKLIKDKKIVWTHFGDGILFDNLKKHIKNIDSNITVNLKGRVSNKEVLNFYKNNSIDLFINVSTSEGIPVSIMEAISFDIPVIATNVGGTSEIVSSQTGILINKQFSSKELKDNIFKILENRYSPREFWKENFNAEVNYANFIKNTLEK